MTPAIWAAIALALVGALLIGVAVGRVWQQWIYGEWSLVVNDAIRDGTLRTYSATPDGRNADNLPDDRYAEPGQ